MRRLRTVRGFPAILPHAGRGEQCRPEDGASLDRPSRRFTHHARAPPRLAAGTPSPRGDTPGSWRTGSGCGSRRGRVLVMDRDVARPAAQVLSGADWQTFRKNMGQTDLYYEFTVEDRPPIRGGSPL